MDSLLSLTLTDWQARLKVQGYAPYRAQQILQWLYHHRVQNPDAMSNLPLDLREYLGNTFNLHRLQAIRIQGSQEHIGSPENPEKSGKTVQTVQENRNNTATAAFPPRRNRPTGGGIGSATDPLATGTAFIAPAAPVQNKDSTQKFLFQLSDGQLIETVLIPASPALYGEKSDRKTLCVSSQVGCAYGCKFCASGLDGWRRNLTPGEIVDQLIQVETLSGEKVNNIVFMGMGEPLANYDAVIKALAILNASWGIQLGARHMTLSTSGLVPRIRDLAEQPLQVRLAISLHGATNAVRERIMPINRKYPLEILIEACEYYAQRKKQKITFEYILIRDLNDDLTQARALAHLTQKMEAKVNLIPYNQVPGLPWERPELERQEAFLRLIRNAGANVTLRREKGWDIAAACGQLRLQTQEGAA